MRAIRLTGTGAALLLALAIVPDSAGQTAAGNLRACLEGYSHCDLSLLDEAARQQVREAENRRHLQDCLRGKRCNPAMLGDAERREVEAAVARLNLENCLRGDGICREQALDDQERLRVEDAAHRRNREYCYSGLAACDPSRLSDAEQAEAHRRYLERNFGNCVPGFERFTKCNPDDLSAEQRATLGQRLREANLYICTHALMGCREELLTPQQRTAIDARRAGAGR